MYVLYQEFPGRWSSLITGNLTPSQRGKLSANKLGGKKKKNNLSTAGSVQNEFTGHQFALKWQLICARISQGNVFYIFLRNSSCLTHGFCIFNPWQTARKGSEREEKEGKKSHWLAANTEHDIIPLTLQYKQYASSLSGFLTFSGRCVVTEYLNVRCWFLLLPSVLWVQGESAFD